MSLLNEIKSPADVKKLPAEKLPELAKEIRDEIIQVTSKNGGHVSPNLGIVELTIALHRVFSTPEDKILFDVSHQCYTHKLLTGRNNERFEGRKDTHRQDELKKELPGILNWVITGALDYQKNGLMVPQEVISNTEGKRKEFDLIQGWLDERCELGDQNAILATRDALASWSTWAKGQGYEYRVTATRLSRLLHAKGIQVLRVKRGGKTVRCYSGIKLIDEFDNLEEK